MVMKSGRLSRKIKLHLKGMVLQKKRKRFRKINAQIMFGPKVLVAMNTAGIGNVVEATPFIQAVRMLWPKSTITILAPSGDLFDGWVVPDKIITSEQQLVGRSFNYTFWAYWIYRERPEWFNTFNPGIVICPKVWLGYMLLKPERQYYLDMLKNFGFKGGLPPFYVSTQQPQVDFPSAKLKICIVPGSKPEHLWRHKRWPYYDKLIKFILERYSQSQIRIIGTDQDEISGLSFDDRIVDLRSRLSLNQTAWVLKNSDIAIGNDCGPMHIADAVQTRSIVIYGPSCELKNAYRNKVIPIFTDIQCRPCQYSSKIESCDDPQCMTKITPQMVMDKLSELI